MLYIYWLKLNPPPQLSWRHFKSVQHVGPWFVWQPSNWVITTEVAGVAGAMRSDRCTAVRERNQH